MTEERYNELKLAIFEKCEDGEITESEKGSLLEALNTVMESTAYNRKLDEYKREANKLEEKKKKLKILMHKKGVSKALKDKMSGDIEEIDKKIRDIETNAKKLSRGDDSIAFLRTSTQYGRSAARDIAGGGDGFVHDYVSKGKDTKDSLIKRTEFTKPEEKPANIYKDYADLKKK